MNDHQHNVAIHATHDFLKRWIYKELSPSEIKRFQHSRQYPQLVQSKINTKK